MSMFSSLLGLDYKAPAQSKGLNSLIASLSAPGYGQQELEESTRGAVANALPDFLQNMQGTRESNIRRGISTGDLGTSFEGDLTSAFQRNIASSVAGQSLNLMQNKNSLLSGLYGDQLDREQAAQNDASQRKSGFIGGAMKLGGAFLGGF